MLHPTKAFLSFTLERTLRDRLRADAEKEGRTLSNMLNWIVREHYCARDGRTVAVPPPEPVPPTEAARETLTEFLLNTLSIPPVSGQTEEDTLRET